jgi:putative membrane protein
MVSNILIALVAALHVYFMYLEVVAWDQPLGRKVFRTTPEFSVASKALAANQGLYNGFLVAGLIWGLWLGDAGFDVKTFFLACVIVAGLFGATTAFLPRSGQSFLLPGHLRERSWRASRCSDPQRCKPDRIHPET